MVGWDDLANFHAALRAQELNPDLRIVVGADNRRLGDHITGLLRDCTVLSSSQLAGPALVAAALGEIAPSHVRVTGQTLYVAGRGDVAGRPRALRAGRHRRPWTSPRSSSPPMTSTTTPTWCSRWPTAPRATSPPGSATRCWPRATPSAGSPRTRSGWPGWARRHPRRAARGLGRQLAGNKFAADLRDPARGRDLRVHPARRGRARGEHGTYSAGNVLYLGIMDLTGSALTSPGDHGAEKVAQVLLTGRRDGAAAGGHRAHRRRPADREDPQRAQAGRRARDRRRRRRGRRPGPGRAVRPGVPRGPDRPGPERPRRSRSPAVTGCRWSSATPATRRRCGRRASRAPSR